MISFISLITELKMLEEEGIKVETSERTFQLYFVLALVVGDNLGVKSVLGFSKSLKHTNIVEFVRGPKMIYNLTLWNIKIT